MFSLIVAAMLFWLFTLLLTRPYALLHELGHAYAARRLGVGVIDYEFGYRKWKLFSLTLNICKKPVHFHLPAIVGAQVNLVGERDDCHAIKYEMPFQAFCCRSVRDKGLIALAGPAANLFSTAIVISTLLVVDSLEGRATLVELLDAMLNVASEAIELANEPGRSTMATTGYLFLEIVRGLNWRGVILFASACHFAIGLANLVPLPESDGAYVWDWLIRKREESISQ